MLDLAHIRLAAQVLRACLLGALLLGAALSGRAAQGSVTGAAPWAEAVQALAHEGARHGLPPGVRVMVEVGQLDSRYRLAPCQRIQPFLPPGLKMWGRTRVGLRCEEGPVRWSVTLPIQVHVFAKALTAAVALPAGTVLASSQLQMAEIDMAAEPGQVFMDAEPLVGRTLLKPLQAGEALRSKDLKARQWFAAGEMVKVVLAGSGFAVTTEGQALGVGLEGQDVRIRMDNGRTVLGRATAERRVEVPL